MHTIRQTSITRMREMVRALDPTVEVKPARFEAIDLDHLHAHVGVKMLGPQGSRCSFFGWACLNESRCDTELWSRAPLEAMAEVAEAQAYRESFAEMERLYTFNEDAAFIVRMEAEMYGFRTQLVVEQ